MSSDLFVFDTSFFTDPFLLFNHSSIDILQSIPIPVPNNYEENSFDQITPTLLSSSPPRHQLENLSLSKTTHSEILSNGFLDYSVLEVKTEECQIPIYSTHDYHNHDSSSSFLPHSYGGSNLLFQPRFDSLMESPHSSFHSSSTLQVLNSPENCFSSGQMRRVCSTAYNSPLARESSFMEEANSKVGKYSPEERKERIHRYKAKRTQRNFNKTIKYACRKILADSRPRIRGRFARNDVHVETPKSFTLIDTKRMMNFGLRVFMMKKMKEEQLGVGYNY